MRLGEILVNHRAITPEQLQEAIALKEKESKRIGDILIERGIVSEEKLKIALQEQYWRKNGYWVINN
jgi:hypothetical protein